MSTLKYVGAPVSVPADLVYQEYVEAIKDADLTTTQVDTQINAGFSSYATVSYVDTKDALNATRSFVDTGDNLRVKIAQKDVINGVPGLDSNGRVNQNRINVSSTQSYNRGPWSPAGYYSAQGLTTETTLFPCPVTDPGYPYKLLCFGSFDTWVDRATEYPVILVREGVETTGPIIAQGRGLQDSYYLTAKYGDDFGGTALDVSKWGALGARPLITWNADSGNGLIMPGSNRQSGVWLGQQPKVDKLRMSFTARNIPIAGSTRVVMHGNAGWTQWVAMEIQAVGTSFNIITGTSPDWLGGNSRQTNSNRIDENDVLSLEYDPVTNKYQMRQNGTARGAGWVDSSNVISHGVGNRNFGILTNAAGDGSLRGTGVDDFYVEEYETNPSFSPTRVIPISMASQSVKTGSTTLYVRANRSATTSVISAGTFNPTLYVMAVPA